MLEPPDSVRELRHLYDDRRLERNTWDVLSRLSRISCLEKRSEEWEGVRSWEGRHEDALMLRCSDGGLTSGGPTRFSLV